MFLDEVAVDIVTARTRRLPYCDAALQVRQSDQILARKACFSDGWPKFVNRGKFVFDICSVTAPRKLVDTVGDIVLILFPSGRVVSLIPLSN